MEDSTIPGKPNRQILDGRELLPSSYNGSPFNISVTSIKNFVVGLFSNKATVLDLLGVSYGNLTFNGSPVGGANSSGLSNYVQLSNGTGGFGSSAQCVFDPEYGTLNVIQIVPEEVTASAPIDSGAATSTSTQQIWVEDNTKSWVVNSLSGKAVVVTRVDLSKEVRLILSNSSTVFTIYSSLPFTSRINLGETYEIIEPTVLTDNFRNQIVRVNLSSGFNHVVQHPFVDADNNRNVITTYIEGHAGTAVCYGITTPPESGVAGDRQTFNLTGNIFELIANRELVSHAAHAAGSFHYDLLYSTGLQAFGEGTWAAQVITANQTVFTPVDNNLTPYVLRRFEGVTVGGQFWGKYTSQIKRNFRFNIVCDGVLNGPNASIVEVGIRHYSASANTTTDYSGIGCSASVSGTGTPFKLNLVKNLELGYGDRFQIVHKNNNATDYTITPKLIV